MTYEIRPASADDLPAMVQIGRAMHAESPRFRAMPFEDDRLAATLKFCMAGGGCFVATKAGQLVGGIAGLTTPQFFGPSLMAVDLAVFVLPEHRGSRAVLRLVAAFEKWAARVGADEVVLGISTGIEVERTSSLYRAMGYSQICTSFAKPIQHEQGAAECASPSPLH